MILVLSQDTRELTTEDVVDWIRALGGDCFRLNADDLGGADPFHFEVSGPGSGLCFRIADREVRGADVGAVWLRRWARSEKATVPTVAGIEPLCARINAHLAAETNAASRGLFALLSGVPWLGRPGDASISKLHVLTQAAAVGLEIPPTLVTNERERIEAFRREHGEIITKSIGETETFAYFGKSYGLYTARVEAEDVAALPPLVFPTLVQAMVPKEFEVRVFFLDGALYGMAIFSQADDQTATDFRRYNLQRSNRSVPYRVPDDVGESIRRLMQRLDLDTGSIDLIRTPDRRHVFLEVNPAGQFGMVSQPCNYHLEKKVAEHLIALEVKRHD